jgi:hypothetical protein
VAGDSQLLTDVAAIERVKYRLPRLEILEPMTLVAFDLLASTREAWRKGQLLDPAQLAGRITHTHPVAIGQYDFHRHAARGDVKLATFLRWCVVHDRVGWRH